MDLVTYAAASFLIIMIWHMAMNTQPRNFDLMVMIALFVFGGTIGWYMRSMEVGIMFSVLSSLFFIN